MLYIYEVYFEYMYISVSHQSLQKLVLRKLSIAQLIIRTAVVILFSSYNMYMLHARLSYIHVRNIYIHTAADVEYRNPQPCSVEERDA